MSSIYMLEKGAGIPVMRTIEESHAQLENTIGLSHHKTTELALREWLSGHHSSTCPPTWKSLLDVLSKLGHDYIRRLVEDYLLGGR